MVVSIGDALEDPPLVSVPAGRVTLVYGSLVAPPPAGVLLPDPLTVTTVPPPPDDTAGTCGMSEIIGKLVSLDTVPHLTRPCTLASMIVRTML